MAHFRGVSLAWLAMAAIAALGCSGEPAGGGEQPYGAGTSASDEPEMPEGGTGAQPAGSGGEGGTAGLSGAGGEGGDVTAGQGGTNELPACQETARPALIGACVALPLPSAGDHVSMTGVVEAIEEPDMSSCALRALGFMSDADAGEVYDVVVRDGESTVRISVRLPWSTTFVNVGETISIEYKAELPADSVGHGMLTVRDKAGRLLLWVVQAARGFDSVAVPELAISDEEHMCSARVPCGTSTHGGVLAFNGTDEVSIPYAETMALGELLVTVGDNTKVTVADTCSATRSFHRVVIAAVDIRVLPQTK